MAHWLGPRRVGVISDYLSRTSDSEAASGALGQSSWSKQVRAVQHSQFP
jgi:hypothetical protein